MKKNLPVHVRAAIAIKRYGDANRQVILLTNKISAHLNNCHGMWFGTSGKTHLSEAYERSAAYQAMVGDSLEEMCLPDVAEQYLMEVNESGECRHCIQAHKLIKSRKEARIKLGRAKAAISALSSNKELVEIASHSQSTSAANDSHCSQGKVLHIDLDRLFDSGEFRFGMTLDEMSSV